MVAPSISNHDFEEAGSNAMSGNATFNDGYGTTTYDVSFGEAPITFIIDDEGSYTDNTKLWSTTWSTSINPNTEYYQQVQLEDDNQDTATDVKYAYSLAESPIFTSASAESPTEISVTWSDGNSSYPATEYNVEAVNQSTLNVDASTTTSSTSATLTGLDPDTQYDIDVYAVNGDGVENSTADSDSATTYAVLSISSQSLDVDSDNANQLFGSFTTDGGVTPIDYTMELHEGTTLGTIAASTSGQSTSITDYAWSTLNPNTQYMQKTEVTGSSGGTDSGNVGPFATVPETPASLQASPISDTELDVTWSDGNSSYPATDYEIELYKSSDTSTLITSATTSSTSATITGLSPDTEYQIEVYARNIDVVRNTTAATALATTDSEFTITLTLDIQLNRSIQASWSISGTFTQDDWTVTFDLSGGGSFTHSASDSGNSASDKSTAATNCSTGDWTVTVESTDSSINKTISATASDTMYPDPSISNLALSNPTTSSLDGSADIDGGTEPVTYAGNLLLNGSIVEQDSADVNTPYSWSYTYNGLQSNTEYELYMVVTDDDGRQVTQSVFEYTDPEIKVTWTHSDPDGQDVSHYNVYRNDSETGTYSFIGTVNHSTGDTSYQYFDYPGHGTWWYTVTAEDVNGNVSQQASPVSATTANA